MAASSADRSANILAGLCMCFFVAAGATGAISMGAESKVAVSLSGGHEIGKKRVSISASFLAI